MVFLRRQYDASWRARGELKRHFHDAVSFRVESDEHFRKDVGAAATPPGMYRDATRSAFSRTTHRSRRIVGDRARSASIVTMKGASDAAPPAKNAAA